MRADEHEGELSDSEVKRQGDRARAHAGRVVTGDLAELAASDVFVRWLGRYLYPAMTQNFPVGNGSALAHFMGKRELLLQIRDEMEAVDPGFMLKLLTVRNKYESDLRLAAQKES